MLASEKWSQAVPQVLETSWDSLAVWAQLFRFPCTDCLLTSVSKDFGTGARPSPASLKELS